MPPREPVLSVATLRHAAKAHADAVGLRQAARDIGMSTMGLSAFLAGTDPQPRTVRKLTAWYAVDRARLPDAVSDEAAIASLTLLFAHLPEDQRAASVAAVLELVEQRSRAAGVDVPGWVKRLR